MLTVQPFNDATRPTERGDRTVKKHMGHIYKKLGVQTLLGAVMYALKRLSIANF
jgi:DNA-binding NarL/FixJ family response regulator